MTDHVLAVAVVILAAAVLILVVVAALARRDANHHADIATHQKQLLRGLRERLRYAENTSARLAAQLSATQAQLWHAKNTSPAGMELPPAVVTEEFTHLMRMGFIAEEEPS